MTPGRVATRRSLGRHRIAGAERGSFEAPLVGEDRPPVAGQLGVPFLELLPGVDGAP
jgi:hypothetical protein